MYKNTYLKLTFVLLFDKTKQTYFKIICLFYKKDFFLFIPY